MDNMLFILCRTLTITKISHQGLVNFWIQAFRLLSKCIQKLESLCAAFLWSRPSLNKKKTKVAWRDVCKLRQEGGLGFKSIKEANIVSCLKLIWSIVGNGESMWAKWVKTNDSSKWFTMVFKRFNNFKIMDMEEASQV